jgi:preprotein translocase subunit SecE
MLQKQGQLGPDGEPQAKKKAPTAAAPRAKEARTSPIQFIREVRGELRKVAWPTREETINYSIIVLVAVVILTAYISAVDYGFGELVLKLFQR